MIDDIDNSYLGLSNDVDLSRLRIYDHLTPKVQKLFYEAKKFKNTANYTYCWTKNGTVFLRQSESSPITKIRTMEDLNKLIKQNPMTASIYADDY